MTARKQLFASRQPLASDAKPKNFDTPDYTKFKMISSWAMDGMMLSRLQDNAGLLKC